MLLIISLYALGAVAIVWANQYGQHHEACKPQPKKDDTHAAIH